MNDNFSLQQSIDLTNRLKVSVHLGSFSTVVKCLVLFKKRVFIGQKGIKIQKFDTVHQKIVLRMIELHKQDFEENFG